MKTKTWLELHAAFISQSQVTLHKSALYNHPGVDRVYNPLQTIRNRLVRQSLNQSLEAQPISLAIPASTSARQNAARSIVWEVDVNEMFADHGWRERNPMLMRDRNNQPLYPSLISEFERRKAEGHRHHGKKRADADNDYSDEASEYSSAEDSEEDEALRSAKDGKKHRFRRHRKHRHDDSSTRRRLKILPDIGLGLTREIEHQLAKRQSKAGAGKDEQMTSTSGHLRRRRIAVDEDDREDSYDSYGSTSDDGSYSYSESNSDASSQVYSEAGSDALIEDAIRMSSATSARRHGFHRSHIHRRGRRRRSEAGQISLPGTRSPSPAKSRPVSPASKKAGPISINLTSPDGLLSAESAMSGSETGAGSSSRKIKSQVRALHHSHHRSRSRTKSATASSPESSTTDLASVPNYGRHGVSNEQLFSPQYRDSNVSKVEFKHAPGSTAAFSTTLLQPPQADESDGESGLAYSTKSYSVNGSSSPNFSSEEVTVSNAPDFSQLVAELQWLEAQFIVQGQRAKILCTVYQRSLSRLSECAPPDSLSPDSGKKHRHGSIPAVTQSLDVQSQHFRTVTLDTSKTILSSLSSHTDVLTSAFSTSFRTRFDFAISAADRLSAEINTTLNLQLRRLGEEIEVLEKEGAIYRRRQIMKNEATQIGYILLDKFVILVLWMVWGVVKCLRLVRAAIRIVWWVVKWCAWC